MKRILVFVLLFAVLGAACGGDDDKDDSAAAGGGGADDADFCEVWPALNTQAQEQGELTPETLDEARALLDDVRSSAPEAIETEVGRFVDFFDRLFEALESGEEGSAEEMFFEIFALAEDGQKIEDHLVETCPGYEPPEPPGPDDTGSLGIPDADLDPWVREIFVETSGADSSSSFNDYEWTIYSNGTAEEALAGCTELSARLAAHADAEGTLKLTIGDEDGTPLAVNEEITPGDAGECVAV